MDVQWQAKQQVTIFDLVKPISMPDSGGLRQMRTPRNKVLISTPQRKGE